MNNLCIHLKFEILWDAEIWSVFWLIFSLYPCRNCSNPKIKGAIVFYEQGPQLFDYSIRLNHTWAFSGFPDVTTIMDTNGPFLNDLELGVSSVPTMQYSFSGFLTVWLLYSHSYNFSFIESIKKTRIEYTIELHNLYFLMYCLPQYIVYLILYTF
jgi:hypothetical protein